MYQALYRKYRPRTFSEVAGQEHVTVTLKRQIVSGRLSHAYLFVGTRGTGKTTCAKILSRALNCEHPADGDPCNECPSCVGIENGSVTDVCELDAASNNGVDDVRALREEAVYSPAAVKKRVYIIDEAHMLSNSAFNALLKILEEPPGHLVFILATTALHKIPATILSRCQRFSFKRLSPEAITARLMVIAQSEGFTLTEEAAKMLSALADGSMRDALSLLDQCSSAQTVDKQHVADTIGVTEREETAGIISAIAAGDAARAMSVFDTLYDNGRDMASLLSEMASLVRDTLVYKLSPDSPLRRGGYGGETLAEMSDKLTVSRMYFILEAIREAAVNLSRGAGEKLIMELCILRLCDTGGMGGTGSTSIPPAPAAGKLKTGGYEPARSAQHKAAKSEPEPEQKPEPPAAERCEKPQAETIRSAEDETTADDETADSKAEIGSLSVSDSGKDTNTNTDTDTNTDNRKPDGDSDADKGGDIWQKILDLLKDDMSIYSLLGDSTRVSAEMSEGTLVVRAGDIFTIGLIESKKFHEPLIDAARRILGENARVRIEIGVADVKTEKKRQIDDLKKFGIVKFE